MSIRLLLGGLTEAVDAVMDDLQASKDIGRVPRELFNAAGNLHTWLWSVAQETSTDGIVQRLQEDGFLGPRYPRFKAALKQYAAVNRDVGTQAALRVHHAENALNTALMDYSRRDENDD